MPLSAELNDCIASSSSTQLSRRASTDYSGYHRLMLDTFVSGNVALGEKRDFDINIA